MLATVVRFLLLILTLLIPASAAAGEAQPQLPPKYPPGFDCSVVAAGSARHACNASHLDPPMGSIEAPRRARPRILVPSVAPQPRPTAPPPTIPRLPGTIPHSN